MHQASAVNSSSALALERFEVAHQLDSWPQATEQHQKDIIHRRAFTLHRRHTLPLGRGTESARNLMYHNNVACPQISVRKSCAKNIIDGSGTQGPHTQHRLRMAGAYVALVAALALALGPGAHAAGLVDAVFENCNILSYEKNFTLEWTVRGDWIDLRMSTKVPMSCKRRREEEQTSSKGRQRRSLREKLCRNGKKTTVWLAHASLPFSFARSSFSFLRL